jgi:hypothetical protein
MNRTDIIRALTAAGFTCTDHPQGQIKATSPMCLWDGSGVEAFVSYVNESLGWHVYDADQAYFMAVSTGLPGDRWVDMEEGYDLRTHTVGTGRLVHDLDAVVSAAWDVVGYQISAHAYAAARRPDPSAG